MRLFVPGRICLFGEHSDWAAGFRVVNGNLEKGYALICGMENGIYAEVAPHADSLILSSTDAAGRRYDSFKMPMEPGPLLMSARGGGFWSYAAGVAYRALTVHNVRGLVINNDRTTLPMKKGLGSSAALCVLVARAFNTVYGLGLSVDGEMELAYRGEIETPSRCGRMDQGCAFGTRPILMTFDGEETRISPLLVGREVHLVIVDLNASKDTVRILDGLQRCYPFPRNGMEAGVQRLLGMANKHIVLKAVSLLRKGDSRGLGRLMSRAQDLFFRDAAPACPEQLSSPVLKKALAYKPIGPHIWGGKGVGSQGDGAAQFVARSAGDQKIVLQILERDLGMNGHSLTIPPSH